MLDFDELEKQINNVNHKKEEMKIEDERLLEDAKKNLSEYFQRMYQLAVLYNMVKDTTFDTGAKYNCIRCNKCGNVYRFHYYDPDYTDTFNFYNSVFVRVNVENELTKAVSVGYSDEEFSHPVPSLKYVAESLLKFKECYPVYEEKMANNLKEWVEEQVYGQMNESLVETDFKKKRVRKERL